MATLALWWLELGVKLGVGLGALDVRQTQLATPRPLTRVGWVRSWNLRELGIRG
jgi:hypothetical protein